MSDDDARLTDFVPADGDDPEDDGDDPGDEPAADDSPTAEDSSADDEIRTDDVSPAVSTAVWRPGGACDACGGAAERRWRDGDALVCADCKGW